MQCIYGDQTFHLASSGAPEPGPACPVPLIYFHMSTSMPLSGEERPNWLFGFGKFVHKKRNWRGETKANWSSITKYSWISDPFQKFVIWVSICFTIRIPAAPDFYFCFPRGRKHVIDAYLPLSFQWDGVNLPFFDVTQLNCNKISDSTKTRKKVSALFHSVVLTVAELQTAVRLFGFGVFFFFF